MTKDYEASKRLRAEVVKKFGYEIGCYDGSCVFGASGGMQTNGGCGCIKLERRELVLALRALATVARKLSARVLELERKANES